LAGSWSRTYREGFAEDIKSLPSRNLQRRALQLLSDCWKVYFDEHDDAVVAVDAITVGRRHLLEVYVEAARRLGRYVD
jgi:hypothetical protein